MENRKHLPQAIFDTAVKFGTLAQPPRRPTDPQAFLGPAPTRFRSMEAERRITVERLCASIGATSNSYRAFTIADLHAKASADRDGIEALVTIYADQARRHAYEGTVLISLMERIKLRGGGSGLFHAVRRDLFTRRDKDPLAWELVRNCGRPSVPKNVAAVFALHRAERQLGRPMENVSLSQLEAMGLI